MEPTTLHEALAMICTRWSAQTALVYDKERMSYAQLWRAVRSVTTAYRNLGISRGDRIICALSNRPEAIVALGAAWASGAVHVGVDSQFTAPEVATILELTQATLLLCEPDESAADPLQTIRLLRQRYPGVRILVCNRRTSEGLLPEGCWALSDLMAAPVAEDTLAADGPAPADPAMVFISSGTTGKPKGAIGYHGNLCQRWRRLGGWLKFSPDDVHLAQLPLSHGFGLMMAVAALLTGGRLALLPDFTAATALQVVTNEGVTVLNGAPTHFKLILDYLNRAPQAVHRLRLSVGTAATFPPELVRAIWDRLGVEFMFMYGSSEGVGVATTDREEILRGSVGRPAPGSVMIVNADHEPLPVGATGEIAFSRKVFPVKYWRIATPTATQGSVQEMANDESEWYYSGDLGRLDDEGRLYVYGRLKQQIDRGGLKVDPVEVEAALLQCPGIADGAVIGIPNPILGETVCACVVPALAEQPSLDRLRTMLKDRLAPYKLPEALYIVDRIPRTPIGKVDLKWLRSEVTAATQQYIQHR